MLQNEKNLDDLIGSKLNELSQKVAGLPLPMVQFPQGYTVHESLILNMRCLLESLLVITMSLLKNADDGVKEAIIKDIDDKMKTIDEVKKKMGNKIIVPNNAQVKDIGQTKI